MSDLYFNGIDGDTGDYLQPAVSLEDYASLARASVDKMLRGRGPKSGIESHDLSATGWAAVFPAAIDPTIRQALRPLLDHRREQATAKNPYLFQEIYLRPNESKNALLTRLGVMSGGPVEPEKIPYYLMLVGNLDQIPYTFQYDMSVQYAVGRVCFDTLEQYETYARSVVEAEGKRRRPAEAMLFGTRHDGDPATESTTKRLVRPLADRFANVSGWRLNTLAREAATKAELTRALGGDQSPAFLMTVSHGLGFKHFDDKRKEALQGALITSDWPGRGSGKLPVDRENCFSAADVGESVDLAGMITFHLACWSAGTPRWDQFIEDRRIAERDFVASLPQRLLSHENGGALAVVGHVDRALLDTFLRDKVSQITLYESVFVDLMAGLPLGWAMRHFGQYAAAIAADVVEMPRRVDVGDEEWAQTWASYRDARGYVILGDPAVRLSLAEDAT